MPLALRPHQLLLLQSHRRMRTGFHGLNLFHGRKCFFHFAFCGLRNRFGFLAPQVRRFSSPQTFLSWTRGLRPPIHHPNIFGDTFTIHRDENTVESRYGISMPPGSVGLSYNPPHRRERSEHSPFFRRAAGIPVPDNQAQNDNRRPDRENSKFPSAIRDDTKDLVEKSVLIRFVEIIVFFAHESEDMKPMGL